MTETPRRTSAQRAGLGSLPREAADDPWGYYERLHDIGDIVWDEEMSAWVVGSYELLRQMTRGEGSVWAPATGDGGSVVGFTPDEWSAYKAMGSTRMLYAANGVERDRQHREWMRMFSGRTVRTLGDTLVRPVAHAQIDRFANSGSAELYEAYAARVAPRVISAALGLPWEDDAWLERFLELHQRRIELLGRRFAPSRDEHSDRVVAERGIEANQMMQDLLRPIVRAKRSGDGEDFISLVWRNAERLFGPGFEEIDVVAMTYAAFGGGSGTTAAMTSSGLRELLYDQPLQARLRAGGEAAVAGFVEEMLRLYGALPYRSRRARRDTELGGVEIRSGELVIGLAHAAGRDGRHYDSPHEIDFDRPSPRDHFAFGIWGTHSCPGQGLARVQLATIFGVALERFVDLRPSPGAEPPRFVGVYVRRWFPLHANFTRPGGRAGLRGDSRRHDAAV